ncbi:multidrug efflux pump subunit AcrA (membrane-fusion protein) [Kribbella voronezhensis]|uniref:Multidrug efflux pump subunit AcrA (Membrane-fusion protein) n=1 Tax=Kribbella voronezhensis TaxID=2512212 RepID=A0A4R7TF19_9ACTN|nr:peptidoglycan-binding protein [Kribbella voronezhensis]TDU90765.1 multidrug efflux pump subunit AcrA (membrane-fusion protein) [Kribbella voronezhensis]
MPRRAVLVVVALAAGGALTAVLLSRSDSSQAADKDTAALPPKTAEVTRQTLTDSETVDGELGYGTTTSAVSRRPGTITWLPETGQALSRGQALYKVNNEPTSIMYGGLPAYRRLAVGSEGPDVLQLEQNLKNLGYTGFTVDDEYTSATADAVEEWQDDRGFDETGAVELGQVVFTDGPVRVDSLAASQGAPIAPGQPVLSYSGTTKAVTVELDAADQRLAKRGARVSATLPDDSTVAGRIDEVSTKIVPATAPEQEPTTKFEVLVAISNQKAPAPASVAVEFTASERKNVLTVPVAALLALQEGGFGVEVVGADGSRYVPVKTGMFAGGRVEISGAGIAAGIKVGVPK